MCALLNGHHDRLIGVPTGKTKFSSIERALYGHIEMIESML